MAMEFFLNSTRIIYEFCCHVLFGEVHEYLTSLVGILSDKQMVAELSYNSIYRLPIITYPIVMRKSGANNTLLSFPK